MPTNAVIVSNAPIAQVLAANDVAKGNLFGARLDPQLPIKIFIVYKIVKKIYDIDPNYSGMTKACLYLWELCGRYGTAAMAYTGGGGSVSPITPPSVKKVTPLRFTVLDAFSPIVTGGSILVLDGTNGQQDYRGYNLIFVRGALTPTTPPDPNDTYFAWDSDTGVFQCFGAATLGEKFQLIPIDGTISGTSPATGFSEYTVGVNGILTLKANCAVQMLVIKCPTASINIYAGNTAGAQDVIQPTGLTANEWATILLPTTPDFDTIIYFTNSSPLTIRVYPEQS